jgi:hypothetical protein
MTRDRALGAKSPAAKPKRRHHSRKKMKFAGNFAPGPAFDSDAGKNLSNNFPLAQLGLPGKFPHCLNEPQNNINS